MVKSIALLIGFAAVLATGLHIQMNHEDSFPDRITFEADTGAYLSRCNNCGSSEYPDSASVHETDPKQPWAIWDVERVGRLVAFRADNGKYLSLCPNCWRHSNNPDAVFVNADTPDDNAQWMLSPIGNGKWGFKGNNGKYLARCNKCVEDGAYENFVFVNDESPRFDDNAQWFVRPA